MALGTMNYKSSTIAGNVEILYFSKHDSKSITLDTTAFTSGVCLAGTPISADGKKAATAESVSNAIGILLVDVYEERPQGTIVIGGYINTSVAQTHSGVTYDAATKAALKNVVFM